MPMKWKRFKKERISLDYTVMLVPHSQKKPIHFKTPVWTFGVIFLGLLVLTGACLFFAGSRHQLTQVRQEKEQLEQEWKRLAEQKQLADQENEILRQEQEQQKKELQELENRTRNTLKELEDLVEREGQIRQELGLEDPDADADTDETQDTDNPEEDVPEEPPEEEEASGQEPGEAAASGQDAQEEIAAGNGMFRAASVELPISMAESEASFRAIQAEMGTLQLMLSEKTGQYEGYLSTIEEKKAAAAAEKARNEALRASIVASASSYIGNAYVYGGNDPHTGVDCSGFTKYILGNIAGVYLNRTAAAQSGQGKTVSAQEARPGDLVFYSNGTNVNHVAIYVGNGQVVHASNERVGITRSDMYYRTPVAIKNVLGD